jgi:hypothetical protein
MQQPQGRSDVPQETTYPDIGEVRTVTTAATCNQLLTEGWVLLGVFPVTLVGEMAEGQPRNGQQHQRIEDRSGMSGG